MSYINKGEGDDMEDLIGKTGKEKWKNFFKKISAFINNEILNLTELVKG